MSRTSDTMHPGNSGLAMMADTRFLGWIRWGQINEVQRRGAEPYKGRITSIDREFEWAEGGGRCCEGLVEIS